MYMLYTYMQCKYMHAETVQDYTGQWRGVLKTTVMLIQAVAHSQVVPKGWWCGL